MQFKFLTLYHNFSNEEKNLVEQLKECIKSWEGKLEDLRSFNLD